MISIRLIETETEYSIAKTLVEHYHSYVPNYNSVGRRIDWLVYSNNELIGMVGIGSATYPPCKDVLNYLGMTKDEYKNIFNTIANNWRYCLVKHVDNAGTQTLKLLKQQAPIEWYKKYGDELNYIVTFIGDGHDGAVYKADNWKHIGYTAGLPKHQAVSMKWDNSESISNKFVKPTGENRKLIFITKLKPIDTNKIKRLIKKELW